MIGGITLASYDLDEIKSKARMLRMIQDVRLDVATMKDLLEKHGLINQYEFDAAKKYHESTPEFQQMAAYLNQVEAQIAKYESDPQSMLRDMMNAKLRGQI